MKTINTFLIFIFSVLWLIPVCGQNQAPVVEKVLFTQRTDGTFFVDVYYDVNDPDGNTMTVSMQVSSDSGVTWTFSCESITGDVGSNITNGTNKHIEWDFGTEHPQTFGDQFRVKIIANDGIVLIGVPCPGTPTVTYEGKVYNTVQISSQCWLKENLDVGTMIMGNQNQTNNGIKEKYCYNNYSPNCTTYGGLYQWNETMQYSTTSGTKGICPVGWHIPTLAEFQILSTTVGGDGNALKEIGQGIGGGTGTNTSGFSALLAGNRYINGLFYNLGYYGSFWSSTEYDAINSYGPYLSYSNSNIYLEYGNKVLGFSVRCVKD